MNVWLLSAGAAALVLDLVHIGPGGRAMHRPMLASHWPPAAKAVWSITWHAATAIMALGGAALIAAAFLPDHAAALTVLPVALFLTVAGLFLYYGATRLHTIWRLPQWLAFLAISALALAGLA